MKEHGLYVYFRSIFLPFFLVAIPATQAQTQPSELVIQKSLGPKGSVTLSGWPAAFFKGLFRPGADCASAKLDLWVEDGGFIVMMTDKPPEKTESSLDNQGYRLVLGTGKCRIRIRIDRAD